MKKSTLPAFVLCMSLFALSGCAAHAAVDVDDDSASVGGGAYFDDDGCRNSLTCTSEFVGDVLAAPFRLVASVIDFVF